MISNVKHNPAIKKNAIRTTLLSLVSLLGITFLVFTIDDGTGYYSNILNAVKYLAIAFLTVVLYVVIMSGIRQYIKIKKG